MLFHFKDVTELRQEPPVNVRHLMNFFNAITTMECSGNCEDALIRRIDQLLIDVFDVFILQCFQAPPKNIIHTTTHLGKPKELIINRPNGLLNCFLKCPSNTHYFTDALHATAQKPADAAELLEVPARDFDDTVVQTGLKTSTSHLSYRVFDFIQRNTKTKFRSNKSERITRRLRS